MAKIALCQDVMVEYMGFMYISAVLKEAGHEVEVFIDHRSNDDRFVAELNDFKPDIVGFSVLTPTLPWSLRIGRRAKETIGVITVYGNIQAVITPEIIEDPAVDIVCLGEGELPMKELAACVDQGIPYTHIKSFWVKTGEGIIKNEMPKELLNLDERPFHDRALYDKYAFFRRSKYLRALNGRGCPFRCSFCSNAMLMDHYGGKRYIRKRSPELAIQELEFHIRQRKVRFIFFVDEVFWVENDWLREFLALYKERVGLPFMATFRAGPIEEEDIRLLAQAGAKYMTLSAETGDQDQRVKLLNKPVKDEYWLRVSQWFRKYKIQYGASAFFGLPGDTVDDHVKRLDFYRRLRPTYLWTTFFQPYPGLKLTEEAIVQKHMPSDKEFGATLHHDMYLDLPDRNRLVNLKKIYFLLMIWPKASPFLIWLTRFRIPVLFDLLFLCHFSYYAFKFEHVSFLQFIEHVRIFALNPLLRNIGRVFTTPWKKFVKSLRVCAGRRSA